MAWNVSAGQLGGTVADDLAERTIDTDETPIERNQCHPDGRFIDREPESFLRFLQRSVRCACAR